MSIVRPIMQHFPYCWTVFISFIIIATFIILNIVIGIIVDRIGEIKEGSQDNSENDIKQKLENIEQQLLKIKNTIKISK